MRYLFSHLETASLAEDVFQEVCEGEGKNRPFKNEIL
jgi:hypothetical protein